MYSHETLKEKTLELLRKISLTPREALTTKDIDLAMSIIIGHQVRALVMAEAIKEVLFELYEEGLKP